jgi:hypothetical protein
MRVWELLTVPRLYPSWADSVLVEAPDRPVVAGDRIVLGTGPARAMRVTLVIVSLAPPRELAIDVHMPLGIVNHEVVRISPISERECRVTYN